MPVEADAPLKRKRGRPIGSKNQRRKHVNIGIVDPDAARTSANKKGRGASFSEEDALGLAKAWVEHRSQGMIQGDNMWSSIRTICTEKHGMNRSAESLRCAWMRIARESQHFINSRALVRKQKKRGMSDDTVAVMVMEVYRKNAGKKDADGVMQYAPPFRYITTAEYLAKEPRFEEQYITPYASGKSFGADGDSDVIGRLSTQQESPPKENGYKENNENDDDQNGDDHTGKTRTIGMASDYNEEDMVVDNTLDDGQAQEAATRAEENGTKARPSKRRKPDDNRQGDITMMASILNNFTTEMAKANSLIAEATNVTRLAAYNDEDLRLLEIMDKNSLEYRGILKDVMRARRARPNGRTPTRDQGVQTEESGTSRLF